MGTTPGLQGLTLFTDPSSLPPLFASAALDGSPGGIDLTRRGYDMDTIWIRSGYDMDTIWVRYGYESLQGLTLFTDPSSLPPLFASAALDGSPGGLDLTRRGYDMDTIWIRYGYDMGTIWIRYGYDMGTIWV